MISRDQLSDSRNTLFHGRNKKLSFVLTLALSDTGRLGNDLDRARILLDSFVHFVDPGDVGDFLVVVPQKDMDNVQQELASYQRRLSIVILDETVVAPSLSYYPDTTNDWPRPNKGWYRQQLIKLGAHRLITTPYYMTLDSDVIVKRPLHLDDVFVADRSVVNLENYAHYQSIYLSDVAEYERKVRIERYQDAERVLKLSRPNDCREVWYGETPVILSRDIVCELVAHIQQIWKCPWQDALLKNLPWTEYALYFLFAEATNSLHKYHQPGGPDSVLSHSQSLWLGDACYRDGRTLRTWPVKVVFGSASSGLCVIIQSYLGIDPVEIRARLAPYIGSVQN